MKKLFVALLATLVLSSTLATAALAAIEVTGDAYVSVNSMYLWRGFDLSTDDYNPDADAKYVVQPGADISFKGFTIGWWANVNENTGEMDETDFVLDYSFDINDLVSMSVGNIFYALDGAEDTNELYVSVSLNTILSPSFSAYYDYDEFDGAYYLAASVGHTFELTDKAGLNLGALISYIDDDEDYSDLHNAELSLGIDYAVTDQVTVSPAVLYSTPISDDADDIIDDEFMGGVTVSLNF